MNRTDRDLIAKLAGSSVRTCLLRRDIIILIDSLRRNMQRQGVGKVNFQSIVGGVAARSDPTPAAQSVVNNFGMTFDRFLNKIIIVNDFYSVMIAVGMYEIVCERQLKLRVTVAQVREASSGKSYTNLYLALVTASMHSVSIANLSLTVA